MTATRRQDSTTTPPVLYLALELGWREWKLGFPTSPAQPVRQRRVRARNLQTLGKEIAKAKQRFGLAQETPVCCCYEAGRVGFLLHRYLKKARNLLELRGIGANSAWLYVMEFFGRSTIRMCLETEFSEIRAASSQISSGTGSA